jgi:hypothetical protein
MAATMIKKGRLGLLQVTGLQVAGSRLEVAAMFVNASFMAVSRQQLAFGLQLQVDGSTACFSDF